MGTGGAPGCRARPCRRNPSPNKRAREDRLLRMARMALSTFSRAACAASTFTYTQRKSPSAPRVEQVSQREKHRGLARLSGCVQDEVAFVPDQIQDFVQIHPFQRRDEVMIRRDDGAFGVESVHGRSMTPRRRSYACRPAPGGRRGSRSSRRNQSLPSRVASASMQPPGLARRRPVPSRSQVMSALVDRRRIHLPARRARTACLDFFQLQNQVNRPGNPETTIVESSGGKGR